jgi:ligand-binding sensor domain-containing protein
MTHTRLLALLTIAALGLGCGLSHGVDGPPDEVPPPIDPIDPIDTIDPIDPIDRPPGSAPPWLRLSRTENVGDVVFAGGMVFAATSTGVGIRSTDGTWTTATPETGDLPHVVASLVARSSDGTVWTGTADGIAFFADGAWQRLPQEELVDAGLGRYVGGPLAVDSLGRLWVVAQGARLGRYDGAWTLLDRTELGITDGDIRALEPGREGSMWVGLVPDVEHSFSGPPVERGGGLVRIGDAGPLEHWRAEDGSLPTNWVLDVAAVGDGSVVALTPEGVIGTDGVTRAPLSDPPASWSGASRLVSGPDGALALSTIDAPDRSRVWTFDGHAWRERTLPAAAHDARVLGIDDEGRVWMSANGLWTLEPTGDWSPVASSSSDIPSNALVDVAVASDDVVWLASTDRGLVRLDDDGFERFGAESDVGADHVQAVAVDSAGAVWLVADDDRLIRYEDGRFDAWEIPFERADHLYFQLTLNADCPGTVWLGAVGAGEGGLLRFEESRWRFFGHEELPTNHSVVSIDCDPEDGVYVGTMYGNVVRYDGARFHEMVSGHDDAPLPYVHSVRVDPRRGGVWVGHGSVELGGLAHFDGGDWTPVGLSSLGGPATAATVLGEGPSGEVLFIAAGTVARIGDDGRSFELATPAVAQPNARALAADSRGNVYFATGGGLVVHRPEGVSGFDRYLR